MNSRKELTILIADTSSTMRKIIKNAITKLEFKQIIEANSGTMVLSILKREQIDILLTEWDIPIINGLSLLKKIRNNKKLKNLPVIIISSKSSKENILSALKERVNYYIVKPFTPELLVEKIENVLDI